MKDKGFTKPWQGKYLDQIWVHLYYHDFPILESLIHNRFLEKRIQIYNLFCTELHCQLILDRNNNPREINENNGSL